MFLFHLLTEYQHFLFYFIFLNFIFSCYTEYQHLKADYGKQKQKCYFLHIPPLPSSDSEHQLQGSGLEHHFPGAPAADTLHKMEGDRNTSREQSSGEPADYQLH